MSLQLMLEGRSTPLRADPHWSGQGESEEQALLGLLPPVSISSHPDVQLHFCTAVHPPEHKNDSFPWSGVFLSKG